VKRESENVSAAICRLSSLWHDVSLLMKINNSYQSAIISVKSCCGQHSWRQLHGFIWRNGENGSLSMRRQNGRIESWRHGVAAKARVKWQKINGGESARLKESVSGNHQ